MQDIAIQVFPLSIKVVSEAYFIQLWAWYVKEFAIDQPILDVFVEQFPQKLKESNRLENLNYLLSVIRLDIAIDQLNNHRLVNAKFNLAEINLNAEGGEARVELNESVVILQCDHPIYDLYHFIHSNASAPKNINIGQSVCLYRHQAYSDVQVILLCEKALTYVQLAMDKVPLSRWQLDDSFNDWLLQSIDNKLITAINMESRYA